MNAHLYLRSLRDDDRCQCGQAETVKHFLLECPVYENQREEMRIELETVGLQRPDTTDLLYGTNFLTKAANEEIFYIVQNYIRRTKRFPKPKR